MSLVKYGGGIIDMKGRLGGQVHKSDRSGKHVCACYTKRRSNSPAQNIRRKWFSRLTNLWKTGFVSAAQMQMWETYAANHPITNKLGEARIRSAFQTFMWWNLISVMNGGEPAASPPED